VCRRCAAQGVRGEEARLVDGRKEGGRKKFGLGTTRAASEIRGEDNGKKRLGLN
jgi:hypothetical protein